MRLNMITIKAAIKKILPLMALLLVHIGMNAQTVPQIVDKDDFSITVKVKGEFKTLTVVDIVDAMVLGNMSSLPLPYTKGTKKLWAEYDEKTKLQISKLNANPLGELAINQIKESLFSMFSKPGTMEEFIEKAVLNDDVNDTPFGS